MIAWNELKVSHEDRKIVERITAGGHGNTLPEEKLNEFKTGFEEDFDIETEAGTVHVFFFRPEDSDGQTLPLYINLHGGGFVKGRRDQDTVLCRNYCSRAHVAVLDIDYLPAPAVRYPGQVYQCYGVLQYCLDTENAKKLGIDPERVMMGGHSAGGNLTAASVLMAIDRGGKLPKYQFMDYAPLDNYTPTADKRNGATNPVVPPELCDFFGRMYVDREFAQEPYCSPVFADDEQLSKMPATFMFYCESDTFCDENAEFNARLLKLGVPVLGKRFLHSDHAFVVRRNGEYEIAEAIIIKVLKSL